MRKIESCFVPSLAGIPLYRRRPHTPLRFTVEPSSISKWA